MRVEGAKQFQSYTVWYVFDFGGYECTIFVIPSNRHYETGDNHMNQRILRHNNGTNNQKIHTHTAYTRARTYKRTRTHTYTKVARIKEMLYACVDFVALLHNECKRNCEKNVYSV